MSTTTATVSVETKELLRVLNLAGKCISSKPSMPILADVLLTYENGGFTVSASNAELWIDVPAQMSIVEGELSQVCVNYAMLRNAVGTLPQEQTLKMTFGEGRLKVDYTKGKFSMITDNADEYPIPDFKANSEVAEKAAVCRIKLNDGWFATTLRNAKTCAAVDTIRPQLAAVLVEVKKDSLNVVSTDGTVMFYNAMPLSESSLVSADFDDKAQMILPNSLVDVITTCFADDELEVASDGTHLSVKSESSGIKLVGRLVDGKYVNYNAIIFAERENSVLKVATEDMLGALKRCNVFASEASHMAVLNNDVMDIKVTVDNIDFATDCGESVSRLDGSTLSGEFQIGFNLVKLSSLLSIIAGANFVMLLSSPQTPLIVKEDNDVSKLILLIMPMSI